MRSRIRCSSAAAPRQEAGIPLSDADTLALDEPRKHPARMCGRPLSPGGSRRLCAGRRRSCGSSNAVTPHLTADVPARVLNAGARVSRVRCRHGDTSPSGSYGTPAAGPVAKGAPAGGLPARRSAYETLRLGGQPCALRRTGRGASVRRASCRRRPVKRERQAGHRRLADRLLVSIIRLDGYPRRERSSSPAASVPKRR